MIVIKFLLMVCPWVIRRFLLNRVFGYKISPSARIGFAWVYPKMLSMAEGSRIDHFTVAINLEKVVLGKNSTIGRKNWITGFPVNSSLRHFKHQKRLAHLIIGNESAITKNHHIDCTNYIQIGDFSTIAGYDSQFLTHSINLEDNIQDSHPIIIGNYTFVGTNVVILGGSQLPSNSVLAARSLLNKNFSEEWNIYGGVPAKPIGKLKGNELYFHRSSGFVF